MRVKIKQSDGKEKYIGDFDDARNLFSKKVKRSKHYMRVLNAWGIDGEYFTNVLKSRGSIILIKDTESGKSYMTCAEVMAKRGEFRHYKPFRAQIFLSLNYWVESGDIVSAERIMEILKQ